jgi:hypothetical protein
MVGLVLAWESAVPEGRMAWRVGSVSWRVLHDEMMLSMSLLMPGQYTQSRALCFVLTIPLCELCNWGNVFWCREAGIRRRQQ